MVLVTKVSCFEYTVQISCFEEVWQNCTQMCVYVCVKHAYMAV